MPKLKSLCLCEVYKVVGYVEEIDNYWKNIVYNLYKTLYNTHADFWDIGPKKDVFFHFHFRGNDVRMASSGIAGWV